MLNLIDIIKAVFLGVIEGLTEFLPVSSTAHLLITSYIIDFQSIQNNLFEIVIQFGAILAICVIYRKRILEVIFNLKDKKQQKFSSNLALAFLPAALIGGLFHSKIKELFFSSLVIAISLIIGGIIMILVDLKPKKSTISNVDNISPFKAFLIGIFQTIAMIPGVSRSGATIVGSLLLGLSRKTAAEFSFFLAIPTIGAASFYDLYKNINNISFDGIGLILIGSFSAFISAVLVIRWFINFVSKNNFIYFGLYRIFLGFTILYFVI